MSTVDLAAASGASALPASLALAERSAPRYTSYPTAPHFHAGVTGETFAQWLGALHREARLSLYLHVPFCRTICAYCGCNTKAAVREAPLDAYVRTLEREIALAGAASGASRVTQIHWGGGTPGLLGPDRLKRLHGALARAFDLAQVEEHAIELDPRHADAALMAGLAEMGVNRVSFGVQDFNPHVQKAIGRVQPFEVVERAVALARAAGLRAINLDLMYGLPEQSLEDAARSARMAAQLAPARLALFGYAHVPWLKRHQRLIDEAALPGAAARLAQAALARETLERAGYLAVGLDHFARADDPLALAAQSGALRRNFQGYVTDDAEALIGLGASAISQTPEGYAQNAPDVAGWRRLVEDGRLPGVRGLALDDDDRLRAKAIERLMCDFTLDYGALALRETGNARALDDARAGLEALAREGVLTHAGRSLRMTRAGAPFVRLAAACFDAYLAQGAARHSAAV